MNRRRFRVIHSFIHSRVGLHHGYGFGVYCIQVGLIALFMSLKHWIIVTVLYAHGEYWNKRCTLPDDNWNNSRSTPSPHNYPLNYQELILRGAIVNRTYARHKNLYIQLFLLTIFGPIYHGPP